MPKMSGAHEEQTLHNIRRKLEAYYPKQAVEDASKYLIVGIDNDAFNSDIHNNQETIYVELIHPQAPYCDSYLCNKRTRLQFTDKFQKTNSLTLPETIETPKMLAEELSKPENYSKVVQNIAGKDAALLCAPELICNIFSSLPAELKTLFLEILPQHSVSTIVDALSDTCSNDIKHYQSNMTLENLSPLRQQLTSVSITLLLPHFLGMVVKEHLTAYLLEEDNNLIEYSELYRQFTQEIVTLISSKIDKMEERTAFQKLERSKLITAQLFSRWQRELRIQNNPEEHLSLQENIAAMRAFFEENSENIANAIDDLLTTQKATLDQQAADTCKAINEVQTKAADHLVAQVDSAENWPELPNSNQLKVKIHEATLECHFKQPGGQAPQTIAIRKRDLLSYNARLEKHKHYQYKRVIVLKPGDAVDTVKITTASANTLLLVPQENPQQYALYVAVDGQWNNIKTQQSEIVTKTWSNEELQNKSYRKKLSGKRSESKNQTFIHDILSKFEHQTPLQKLALKWPENDADLTALLPHLDALVMEANHGQPLKNETASQYRLARLKRAVDILKASFPKSELPSCLEGEPIFYSGSLPLPDDYKNNKTEIYYIALRTQLATAYHSPGADKRVKQHINAILRKYPESNNQTAMTAYQELENLDQLEKFQKNALAQLQYRSPDQLLNNLNRKLTELRSGLTQQSHRFFKENYQDLIQGISEIQSYIEKHTPKEDLRSALERESFIVYNEALNRINTLFNEAKPRSTLNPIAWYHRQNLTRIQQQYVGEFHQWCNKQELKLAPSNTHNDLQMAVNEAGKNVQRVMEGNNYAELREREVERHKNNPHYTTGSKPEYSSINALNSEVNNGKIADIAKSAQMAEQQKRDLLYVNAAWNKSYQNDKLSIADAAAERDACEKQGSSVKPKKSLTNKDKENNDKHITEGKKFVHHNNTEFSRAEKKAIRSAYLATRANRKHRALKPSTFPSSRRLNVGELNVLLADVIHLGNFVDSLIANPPPPGVDLQLQTTAIYFLPKFRLLLEKIIKLRELPESMVEDGTKQERRVEKRNLQLQNVLEAVTSYQKDGDALIEAITAYQNAVDADNIPEDKRQLLDSLNYLIEIFQAQSAQLEKEQENIGKRNLSFFSIDDDQNPKKRYVNFNETAEVLVRGKSGYQRQNNTSNARSEKMKSYPAASGFIKNANNINFIDDNDDQFKHGNQCL